MFLTAPCPTIAAPPLQLSEFKTSRHYDEQIREFTFDPDVLVHINAPAAAKLDPELPTRLIVFALPNGNTTAQTIGKQMAEGVDWHFNIQHIGAQTRALRSAINDCNIIVAYIEAKSRSWPHWRKSHEDSGTTLIHLVDNLKRAVAPLKPTVELMGHSGGGSMIFGYIEAVDAIPRWLTRIVWLDANYNYKDAVHADKLMTWLGADNDHALAAISYDDRDVTFNGKKIVSDTGGTYRRTHDMATRINDDIPLTESDAGDVHRWTGLDGRVELIVLRNPDLRILHTVLVERNGFIHAATFATPHADSAGVFWEEPSYRQWIQPD